MRKVSSLPPAARFPHASTAKKLHFRCFLPFLAALGALAHAAAAAAAILPADRLTTWNPGIPGGVPLRTTVCATVNASTYGNGTQEASGGIQAAINACPVGQVVQLSAGTFKINTNHVQINKGITLRGAGSLATTLQKTNGAVPGSDTVADARPIVIIGPSRWPDPDDATARNLTADGMKSAFSVTVTSAAGFVAGQFALLDEENYNTGGWVTLPNRNGVPTSVQIWATDRVTWQRHNPSADEDDPFPGALTWFSRSGRPVNEIKEIASVSGNTVTFTTPIHITYRTSHTAQLTRWSAGNLHVRNAGLEDLKVIGGGDGAVRFEAAAYSWVKGVEDTVWLGEGVAINHSFRCELRDSYIHDAAKSVPGGGAYAVSIADGSAEILVENNIIMKANKMMVGRSSGAGSVIGYNYADDGLIEYNPDWVEVGINGSHMVGAHHMLFEGNESFNYDSDSTHGSAIYHTVFRNHLSGVRRTLTGTGNGRAAGLGYGSWWHSFVGNVLGYQGMPVTGTEKWVYEDPGDAPGPSPWGDFNYIWRLGYEPIHWEQMVDPKVRSGPTAVLREGNFDYVSNLVHWDTVPQALPDSLYLTSKPAFFGSLTWPWVDPLGATKLHTLPARARYEGGSGSQTLTVTRAGAGSGTVSSSPAGISCGATCSASYGTGTVVTLTAAPAGGSAFSGWSGACSGTASCQVTMSAARSVTATFALTVVNQTLTVTKAGAGSGTVTSSPAGISCGATCGASYGTGTVVTLAAAPAGGSTFSGWSGACSGAASCQVTMSAARAVTATFASTPVDQTLTLTKAGSGRGTLTSSPAGISCGGACSASYTAGSIVSLTAVPRSGSTFTGWSGACSGTAACQVTMDAARGAVATFTARNGRPLIDFNGDGTPDVLWRHQVAGANAVWFLNGVTLIGGSILTADADTDRQIVGTADFDGDGKADILWRNQVTGANIVWFMDGVARTSTVNLSGVSDANYQIVGVADFNADGEPDILWRNQVTGDNSVWFMDAVAKVGSATLAGEADTDWQIVGAADFNGDGKADILWRHRVTGANRVWFMDGPTRTSSSSLSSVADTAWQIVGTADFNRDGKTDILWRHQVAGVNAVWLMNGVTRIGGAPLSTVPDANWRIVGPN